MTLTTDNPANVDWKEFENEVQAGPARNFKTVECQLERTYELIAATEANIEMFGVLMKLNLATNDIKNFVKKQIIHRRVDMKPDLRVQKLAMKSKLADACAFSKRLRKKRDVLKSRLCKRFGNSCGRRMIDCMVKKFRAQKKAHMDANRVKIERMKQKDKLEKALRYAPPGTEKYLENVNIFTPSQYEVKPEEPVMPFVCDPSIELSKEELELLARGPKYMIRDVLDREEFEVELEKMVAKQKFDNVFSDSKDDCTGENSIEHQVSKRTQTKPTPALGVTTGTKFNSINSEKEKEILWEESSGKMIYDLKQKSLNFANLRASEYKYNKRIFMPEPEKADIETLHEVRRTEMRKVFNRAAMNSNSNQSGKSKVSPSVCSSSKSESFKKNESVGA